MSKRIQSLFLSLVIIFALGCNPKGLDQSTMFKGRNTTNKKKGHYDTGTRKNKPMSVQLKQDYDKLSKHDTNPKKAARKEQKELDKKKKAAAKKTKKFTEKKKYKVKTTKGKTEGDN